MLYKLKISQYKDSFVEKFYESAEEGVYNEGGFVVELLVKKFGKQKLFRLIKSLSKINNQSEFKKQFLKIYGFDLNYREINKRYASVGL